MKNFEHNLKKIYFDYEMLETFIAGIELKGNEVKSVRSYNFSLSDSHCFFLNKELFIKNFIISGTEIPNRDKKILLKKEELNKLERSLIKGLTIIPYSIFQNDKGKIKLKISLARRNKNYEKKQKLKEKDLNREKNLLD